LRRHLLLVREILLLLMQLVLVKRLLRPDVQAATNQRVGVDVVDHIAVDALDKLMRRQSIQHGLAFGRVRGPHDKTSGREVIFVLSHDLLLGLTGRERTHAEQHAGHDCEFRNPYRIHLPPPKTVIELDCAPVFESDKLAQEGTLVKPNALFSARLPERISREYGLPSAKKE
jgi:hypothetical protein